MDEFTNEYGGFISFDDDVCLFTSADGCPPMDIASTNED